jgi:hypothetical protein
LTAALGVGPLTFNSSITFARLYAAGVAAVRLGVDWSEVAPKNRPSNFNAADPRRFGVLVAVYEREISAVVAAGLEPIVYMVGAPSWAEQSVPKPYDGAIKARRLALALFARAAPATAAASRGSPACATGCSGTSRTSSLGSSSSS